VISCGGPSMCCRELTSRTGRVGGAALQTARPRARRTDIHEEGSVKIGARRARDFPDIHSASSAAGWHWDFASADGAPTCVLDSCQRRVRLLACPSTAGESDALRANAPASTSEPHLALQQQSTSKKIRQIRQPVPKPFTCTCVTIHGGLVRHLLILNSVDCNSAKTPRP
jgi:hypothetical protein